MITDNQAKEAVKTLAEYCEQHTPRECRECALRLFCKRIAKYTVPGRWPEYLEGENE